MYKICYNDKVIKLAHIDLDAHLTQTDKSHLIVHYPGRVKFILQYLDNIEKNKNLKHLYILAPDVEALKRDFFSQFKIVKAAGGLVINKHGKVLFIFRRGHWDLPKGKMEEGETKRISAQREVIEETGLSKVAITQKLTNTYHIYRGQSSNKRILKPTYWFLMHAKGSKVTPQVEEDIEKVEWKKLTLKTMEDLTPIYSNIKDVLRSYLGLIE